MSDRNFMDDVRAWCLGEQTRGIQLFLEPRDASHLFETLTVGRDLRRGRSGRPEALAGHMIQQALQGRATVAVWVEQPRGQRLLSGVTAVAVRPTDLAGGVEVATYTGELRKYPSPGDKQDVQSIRSWQPSSGIGADPGLLVTALEAAISTGSLSEAETMDTMFARAEVATIREEAWRQSEAARGSNAELPKERRVAPDLAAHMGAAKVYRAALHSATDRGVMCAVAELLTAELTEAAWWRGASTRGRKKADAEPDPLAREALDANAIALDAPWPDVREAAAERHSLVAYVLPDGFVPAELSAVAARIERNSVRGRIFDQVPASEQRRDRFEPGGTIELLGDGLI